MEIQLKQVAKRLAVRHISLSWDDKVLNHLAKQGYDPIYGARPLKRFIQHQVISPLSRAILEGEIPADTTVQLTSDGHAIDFVAP